VSYVVHSLALSFATFSEENSDLRVLRTSLKVVSISLPTVLAMSTTIPTKPCEPITKLLMTLSMTESAGVVRVPTGARYWRARLR
jgi:hypothetical protein